MRLLDEMGKVSAHYSRETDVLELEFGDGIRRTGTIAYEDLYLIHLGTKVGESRLLLQGITLVGFKKIREGVHGILAGRPEDKAAEAAELFQNLDFEIQKDASVAVLKDRRVWDVTSIRLRKRIGPHVEIVLDAVGNPIGAIFDDVNGLDGAAIGEFFDLLFSAILPTDDERHDPLRLALGRELVVRWIAPLVAVA